MEALASLSASDLAHLTALKRDEERRAIPPPPAAWWYGEESDAATALALAERGRRYLDQIGRVTTAAQEMAEEGYFSAREIARALIEASTGGGRGSAVLTVDEAKAAVASGLASARVVAR